MKKNYPYLKDSAFLLEIDKLKNKEQYVKIILLDFNEDPIQAIQGRVVSGSINLDGNSSIRRTCNLTMIADEFENDLTNVNNLISINKKVVVEVGIVNTTKSYTEYDIIWFPLGTYVIINPSISNTTSGVTISLQLKDKMCLLNGECGGVIPASTTFHEYETIDENGEYIIVQPTIYQIIQELVNHFGGEQLGKIIISDIDTRVKQVMRWVGNSPLYIGKNAKAVNDANQNQYHASTNLKDPEFQGDNLEIKTYEYGKDIGYIYTDFTYPGELIADAGNSVCDILDKIKNTLGNYEYFYDLDGNFVFQEIKNYLNTTYAKVELDKINKGDYFADYSKGKAVYIFDDSTLITSYSNTPQYNMIKNDFVVWGMRKTATGQTFPIRYHLAIDEKPTVGNTYPVFFYEDPDDKLTKAKCPLVYPDFQSFPTTGVKGLFYKDNKNNAIYRWNPVATDTEERGYIKLENVTMKNITTKDWRTELYLSGTVAEPLATDSNYYYTELQNEWPKLYDVQNGKFFDTVMENPFDVDFYLDFIDSGAGISEISVKNIGRRSKVVNDDKINCIFEPEIPNLILIDNSLSQIEQYKLLLECELRGDDYIKVNGKLYSGIATGGTFNSAYNTVRDLLYQYTKYNESITLNAIPIFYLEPNTRITVRDAKTGIYGDYMMNTISLPLDVSGTMSISCTRALERV